jgi:hypothetical protein
MLDNFLDMFNSNNTELKEAIVGKSKQMNISLNKEELNDLTSLLSFVTSASPDSTGSLPGSKLITMALNDLIGSREMDKLFEKGIELEYTDGTKEILKNKK